MTEGPSNGSFIRWRDLDSHRELESNARHSLDVRWEARHSALEVRVNAIESLIDQWRGARALIYALVGTNLLAVVVGLAVLLR